MVASRRGVGIKGSMRGVVSMGSRRGVHPLCSPAVVGSSQ